MVHHTKSWVSWLWCGEWGNIQRFWWEPTERDAPVTGVSWSRVRPHLTAVRASTSLRSTRSRTRGVSIRTGALNTIPLSLSTSLPLPTAHSPLTSLSPSTRVSVRGVHSTWERPAWPCAVPAADWCVGPRLWTAIGWGVCRGAGWSSDGGACPQQTLLTNNNYRTSTTYVHHMKGHRSQRRIKSHNKIKRIFNGMGRVNADNDWIIMRL